MRVLVICGDSEHARRNPESAAAVLADLGSRVTCARFDLKDLPVAELGRLPPTVAVFDAGDHLELATMALREVAEVPALHGVPRLLILNLPRLPALDFSAGWDDFALAPLVPAELYARVRQLDWRSAAFGSDEVIKVGPLLIDVAGYEAMVAGRQVSFTHQEFELLRFLAQNRGRAFTREALLARVWGHDYAGSGRTVDIHVRRLRAKLGPTAEYLVATVRNVGYKMVGDVSERSVEK